MRSKSLLSLMTVVAFLHGPGAALAAKQVDTMGRLTLSIDGEESGYVKKVSGGTVKGEVVSHDLGTSSFQKKHLATISHEPLTMELDMTASEPIWDWVQSSITHGHLMADVSVLPDRFSATQLSREFRNAVVTQVTFPALDASSKESCYVTVTAQPESIAYGFDSAVARKGLPGAGRPWQCSDFRLQLGDLPTEHVMTIDAITLARAAADPVGSFRSARTRTHTEISNILLTIATADIDAWFDWFNEFVLQGQATDNDELTGSLEFLDPGMRTTLARIELDHVGIVALRESGTADADGVARFEVELYVEEIAFEHFGAR